MPGTLELENLYRGVPIGLATIDTDLRFLHINERLAEIHGRSVEEHLGRTVSEMRPTSAAAIEAAIQGVIRSKVPVIKAHFEGSTAPEDDHYWSRDYSIVPVIGQDGEIRSVNCLVDDVTDERRARAALRQSEQLSNGQSPLSQSDREFYSGPDNPPRRQAAVHQPGTSRHLRL